MVRMIEFEAGKLKAAAQSVVGEFASSVECSAGTVAAALLTRTGQIFTGICVDFRCSLGFCAEQAAIVDMLKHRISQVVAIVAVRTDGTILPPCGRCREMI